MTTTSVICPPCPVCNRSATLVVDADAVTRWKDGAFVQDAFPFMSPADREVLISGTHPACWTEMFGEEEEEEW